ncbi:homeobox-leucine zipper protein hat22 [Quercus suber]|uniref:Homeobox-leucine zipper protein hat22 n=1 Tax=Quercus suber TaxID=58331 RepID=A0AAW0LNP1_QUESU
MGPDDASSLSAVSSFSNSSSIKRERELSGGEEEVEVERVSSRVSDEDEEASPRKKLRLTKEQSAILEDNFKEHATLNPKQKQDLAHKLNLRPRQVEVWFQNRRARTKLKQTEVDCELLKKCCERLTDENKKLQKELQELKSLKLAAPFYMQLPAATLTMCPSCERICNGGDGSSTKAFLAFGEEEICTAAGTQLTGNCSKAIALYSGDLNNNNQNFG